MSTHAQDFGTLRSLIQSPGTQSWRRICGLLDRYWLQWETPFVREQLVPYVEAHMDHWPRELLRYAQHSWVHDAMCGRDVPQLQYATAMHFVSQDPSKGRLGALSRSPYLGRMRRVDFDRGFDQDRVLTILGAKSLGKLEWLNLGSVRLELEALELFAHACPGARVLDLTAVHPRVLEVVTSRAFPQARAITLARNAIGDARLLAWARSNVFQHMEKLDVGENKITYAGAHQLSTMPRWTQVEVRW